MMIERRRVGKTRLKLDSLGMGCSTVGNLYRAITDEDARHCLDTAWASGFRYFDTAPFYGLGLSERRVGDALREHAGESYVLSTKVGRLLKAAGYSDERHGFCSPMPFDFVYDYSYDGVMRSFEESLQRLGLDRVDILYMHDIGSMTHGSANSAMFDEAMHGGYRALDELRRNGDVKAIGLGVNETEVCEQALEQGDWDCFMLAGRYTLLDQSAVDTLLPKCIARDVSIVLAGPYNSGILAKGVRGEGPWNYDYGPAPDEIVQRVAVIEDTCDEFGVPLAAAALQFPLAHPAVVSVVVGLGSSRRVEATTELAAYAIPAEFWRALHERGLIRAQTLVPR